MPHVGRAFEAWVEALGELSQAEQALIGWRLKRPDPPPPELISSIASLRDRANFLFEVASQLTLEPVEEPN